MSRAPLFQSPVTSVMFRTRRSACTPRGPVPQATAQAAIERDLRRVRSAASGHPWLFIVKPRLPEAAGLHLAGPACQPRAAPVAAASRSWAPARLASTCWAAWTSPTGEA